MILLGISFIAGLLTVLAPCVLPLLPIIVGGSVGGGKSLRRAVTVTVSLAVSVIFFTLLIKASTLFIGIPAEFWKSFSGGIIIAFGLVSLFPGLWEKTPFLSKLSIGSNKVLASGYKKQSVWGDIIVGASLGPVFSSCSPTYFLVLAAVLPENFALGLIYLVAYSMGLSLALLFVAFVGQKILDKAGVAANPRGKFKKILGVIFIIVGIAIISGADKTLQVKILDAGFFDVTKIEQVLLKFIPNEGDVSLQKTVIEQKIIDVEEIQNGLENKFVSEDTFQPLEVKTENVDTTPVIKSEKIKAEVEVMNQSNLSPESDVSLSIAEAENVREEIPPPTMNLVPKADKKSLYELAPEIVKPNGFINTGGTPITLGEFKGKKVVLVSFWTYSCINCQRTLPYLNTWYDRYKDQGLEIVSIHTPEFAFEKVLENVEEEVKNTYDIRYPVVLDNNYLTWKAFRNHYWPRKYLIDVDGYIVYDHIGEGAYVETEQAILNALIERAERLKP